MENKFSIKNVGKAGKYDFAVYCNNQEFTRVTSPKATGIVSFLKSFILVFYRDKMYKQLKIK